jgi:hypothetical protein
MNLGSPEEQEERNNRLANKLMIKRIEKKDFLSMKNLLLKPSKIRVNLNAKKF